MELGFIFLLVSLARFPRSFFLFFAFSLSTLRGQTWQFHALRGSRPCSYHLFQSLSLAGRFNRTRYAFASVGSLVSRYLPGPKLIPLVVPCIERFLWSRYTFASVGSLAARWPPDTEAYTFGGTLHCALICRPNWTPSRPAV